MDEDFNTYDSAHVAVAPEKMTRDELKQAYQRAWDQFYSTDHMVNVLRGWRNSWHDYWNRLFFFAAYLYSARVERLHPMNCGFWTRRWRDDRRSGFPREALIPFWWKRAKTVTLRLTGLMKLFFQLEEVWLRSRPKSKIEEALEELIIRTKQDVHDWREIKTQELVQLYTVLHDQMPEVKIPSVMAVWIRKHNPFAGAYTRAYARRIWQEWYRYIWNPLKWVDVWMFEWVNGVRFLRHLLIEGR